MSVMLTLRAQTPPALPLVTGGSLTDTYEFDLRFMYWTGFQNRYVSRNRTVEPLDGVAYVEPRSRGPRQITLSGTIYYPAYYEAAEALGQTFRIEHPPMWVLQQWMKNENKVRIQPLGNEVHSTRGLYLLEEVSVNPTEMTLGFITVADWTVRLVGGE